MSNQCSSLFSPSMSSTTRLLHRGAALSVTTVYFKAFNRLRQDEVLMESHKNEQKSHKNV